MNFQSRSTSLSVGPQVVRRPSASSRLSSAVSIAERGETQDGGRIAAQHKIEEANAKIKRYEVCLICRCPSCPSTSWLRRLTTIFLTPGLHYHRYAPPSRHHIYAT